jgi:hypothetical protein
MATQSAVFFFTGTNQFWDWPAGVTQVTVECLGGGGTGGLASGNPAAGGGGAGASYVRDTVTKGAETQLMVWPERAGSASFVRQGVTNVVSSGTAAGGGDAVTVSANGAGGAFTGGASIGAVKFTGGFGGAGVFTATTGRSGAGGGAGGPAGNGTAASGGTAGTTPGGAFLNGVVYSSNGAAGVADSTPGVAAANYGGGSSGGKANTNTDRQGGLGSAGVIVLTWTIPSTPTQQPVAMIA